MIIPSFKSGAHLDITSVASATATIAGVLELAYKWGGKKQNF